MNKQERAAIDAVAAHVSATWTIGKTPSDAILSRNGKRIAVRVVTVKRRRGVEPMKPRLRFDKVAIELVGRLKTALAASVTDGKTVMVTVTAPIRLSGKTALALEERIRPLLAGRAAEFEDMILGNAVRVRIAKTGIARAPKVVGFVHNPGLDTRTFFDVVQSLITGTGMPGPVKSSDTHWLILIDNNGFRDIETCRQVYNQLGISTDFKRILMVFDGTRVETLTG
jgi:hypothetical protein